MIDIKKIKIALNKQNKFYAVILFFLWLIFTFMELIGITSIPIFLSLLLESENSFKLPILKDYLLYFGDLEKKEILLYFVGIIILIFLIKNTFFAFLVYFEQMTARSITLDIKKRTFSYYFRKPFKEQLNSNSSDVIRKITLDAANAVTYVNSSLTLFFQLVLTSSIAIYLLYIDFFLTITILMFFILILLTIYFFSSKRLSLYGKLKQKYAGEGIKIVNEGINNIKEVIIYKKINFLNSLYSKLQKYQQDQVLKISMFKRLPRGIYELLTIAFMMFVVLFKIFINEESVESTIVFLTLIIISLARILPSINLITLNLSNIKSTEYSFNLITNNFFDLKRFYQTVDGSNLNDNSFKFVNNINFNQVSFRFHHDKQLLNNISFKIEKNSIIGIFGESGSGKSTILNLLTGLLKPTKGNISIDKFDLKDDKVKDLWQNIIGYIPQDNFLLDDTVKKNIIFSNKFEEVNQTNLDKAIYLAKIDKFISSLKDGIETKIGDRGINISGGQRQRIGIARALYNDPEVLIFDEATSSLDFETENEILDEIYAIKNKTIIMISHNLESLNRCQKILKLKDGSVSDLKFNQ
tara:strand:+ start:170 stop:1915 length:1746 start_codon:yes stop_codon:yes gene_type:complete